MEISLEGIGTPSTEKALYIAPTAVVAGDVTIGENSSVWFGAVIRGDSSPIRIGSGTNVQDNCLIHCDAEHPVTIGDRVSIGHSAVVHGCTLEDGCLIGMHATVLNGAVVGEGSLIAAGAVVKENTVIPPYTLAAGVPAQVKGTLSETNRAYLSENWKKYVRHAQHYLKGTVKK